MVVKRENTRLLSARWMTESEYCILLAQGSPSVSSPISTRYFAENPHLPLSQLNQNYNITIIIILWHVQSYLLFIILCGCVMAASFLFF